MIRKTQTRRLAGAALVTMLVGCGGGSTGSNTGNNTDIASDSAASGTARETALGFGRGHSADARARALVAQMTREEKLQLVRGWAICGLAFSAKGSGLNGPGFIPGIARLGIPDLNMTDGGAGIGDCSSVSPPFQPRVNPEATALPAPLALAATWDTELAYDYGVLLGNEARAQGFSIDRKSVV